VTEIDKKINHYLIEKVNEKYPDHSVIGEEEISSNTSNYIWVCDPVDGTGMFTNSVPVCVFSLALVVDGDVQVGVVYDPFLDKMYTAVRGKGAYCNGEEIHVNDKHVGDLGYRVNYEMWDNAKFDTMEIVHDMLPKVRISNIGSVARSCVAIASGDFSCDLFPGFDHGNCDMAASALIVEEAGGKVTDFYGNIQKYDKAINGAIITNGVSHDEVLEYVKKYVK
jgi:myo-inositol-1(or 4)-monophosphatase